ncbi:MAG: COX15/CtaA family protein [Chitinophagales bacterium]|nr:COX15/CtaA family protein [Chitinophagales bacterium]MDW8417846.1 COX15/CtaA family protein [Chitinophagales bacterium]
MNNLSPAARRIIGIWLLTGCLMVFFQVIVGGVTRLTDSGLSITEWKPIKGIVPPLNEKEWQAEFALYKNITQYKTLNEGMTLNEFKWIYFWEYFHRFWARFMGIVFAVPFTLFILRGWLTRALLFRLVPLFLWGGIIGIYGWIMVRSGLTGVYVPPIHLSIHLLLALSLFAYLVWVTAWVWLGEAPPVDANTAPRWMVLILILLFFQIFMGGLVSGTRAGLAANDWPLLNGELIPKAIWEMHPTLNGILKYDASDYWIRIFVQFLHRSTAYLIAVMIALFWWKYRSAFTVPTARLAVQLLPLSVCLQIIIGVLTVINCVGKIPVFYGVLHQVGAMLLIANVVVVLYHLRQKTILAS